MNLINFKAGFAGIKWDKRDSKGRTAPVLDNAGDDAAGLSRTQEGSCARDRVCTPVSRVPARSRAPFHCAHPGLLAIAPRGLALHGAMVALPPRAVHSTMVRDRGLAPGPDMVDDFSGVPDKARMYFTALECGHYDIATSVSGDEMGTYRVSVMEEAL